MDDRTRDRALIDRARSGDEHACRLLVEELEPAVAATVVGMLGRGDDADDVGQETFIRFFNSLDRFRGESSLKTYVQRIAINLSLNALKSRRRSSLRFLSFDDDTAGVPHPAARPIDDPDARETSEVVRAALDGLSPRHRAVVVLRMIDGCSTRETADVLGVPEGTVLSRLARAMKELQIHLRPYVHDGAAPGGRK